MCPTRNQVKVRFQSLLDDPTGAVFDELVFAQAFGEAYDALFTAFLTNQVPRIELVTRTPVPANTKRLTPSEMGITDFGDYINLSERPQGSTGRYQDMIGVDRLPQSNAGDRLGVFVFSDDAFHFVGATRPVELEIKYDSSGTAPTSDATEIRVDGCLTFLSNYAVGVAGGRKGYDEIAARCFNLAVGPRYDMGLAGGELFRLVQTRVRSRQKVQIAPRPYSANGRIAARRAVPYVQVQPGTTD